RRWRPEAGKTLPQIPEGIGPVVRFKTPLEGATAWYMVSDGILCGRNK
ncbi:glutamate--tRNA ligase, partial [Neisseria iguanae]